MPAPDAAFTISTDTEPEFSDFPDDYSVKLDEVEAKSWEFSVSDDGLTDPLIEIRLGAAQAFLETSILGGKVTIKLKPESVEPGAFSIEVKATDDAGQATSESFTINILAELEIFVPEYQEIANVTFIEVEEDI